MIQSVRSQIWAWAAVLLNAAGYAPAPLATRHSDALVPQGMQTGHAQLTVEAGASSDPSPTSSGGNTFEFGDFGISILFTSPPGSSQRALAEALPSMAIQGPGEFCVPGARSHHPEGLCRRGTIQPRLGIRAVRSDLVDSMDPVVVSHLKDVLAAEPADSAPRDTLDSMVRSLQIAKH